MRLKRSKKENLKKLHNEDLVVHFNASKPTMRKDGMELTKI